MRDYNDYQLDEAEDAAVDKSKNLKRGAIAGAAVLGVGGTAAAAAYYHKNHQTAETDSSENTENEELTSDDLLAAANSAVTESENGETVETVENVHVEEVHVHHHYHAPVTPEPDVQFSESGYLFDEDGNLVSEFDAGTIDGKDFVMVDSDFNGYADRIGYDLNGNHIIEDNEIFDLDNQSIAVGNSNNVHYYAQTPDGSIEQIPAPFYYADGTEQVDRIDDIRNDFENERTLDINRNDNISRDLADNNPDYRNDEGQQYGASNEGNELAQNDDPYQVNVDDTYEETQTDVYAETEVDEPIDYGYTEPADDLAYDANADAIDVDSDFTV